MFLKNLLRRKIRTLLTVVGISIGVAAIIGLGSLADNMEAGYGSMISGSKADLVLSQPDAFDISLSSVDEAIGQELAAAPEVSAVSGMIEGFAQTEGQPFLFIFGYPSDSFVMERFQIIDGVGLQTREAQQARGKPILLGSATAEVLKKNVGDTVRMTDYVYRVIGIYQTGDAFEDSGAVLELSDAQEALAKPRQVSLFYIRLKDPALRDRFVTRVERQYSHLTLSGLQEYADQQVYQDILRAFVWAIGGLAILIGGIGMMNAQLMAVMERTHEIGVLRATGWSRWRVLVLIMNESISVCLLGGLLGIGLGWLLLHGVSQITVLFGAGLVNIRSGLIIQAFIVVFILGLFGGLYPAWRASRMQPVEALRYEGGTSGSKVRRLPFGGMAIQSLWQRSGRTFLTLSVISLTVGSIMALEGVMNGFLSSFSGMLMGTDAEIMMRQANVSDTELSAIDESIGERIAAMPGVTGVSGVIFTAVMLPDYGNFFILFGYAPNEFAIQRYRIVEGKPLTGNHQMILGRMMANMMKKGVGDTLDLSGTRFRIAGIYETGISWEEAGGVVTLRDSQVFAGRPHKVSMFAIKLSDSSRSQAVVAEINQKFPQTYASLAGDFVSQMPDMQTMNGLIGGITLLAVLVGGVGVLNTMLMSVFERTREIGVLRSMGWQRRAILGLILQEALTLGLLGGLAGVMLAIGLAYLMTQIPNYGDWLTPAWQWQIFARAITVALLLGALGGVYPAYRATRLQPIEALRYE